MHYKFYSLIPYTSHVSDNLPVDTAYHTRTVQPSTKPLSKPPISHGKKITYNGSKRMKISELVQPPNLTHASPRAIGSSK